MKQKITVFILVLIAAALNLQAQINEGGTPIGVTNNLVTQVTYVNMPSFNLQQMQTEDAINDQQKGWWRFGFNHEVSLTQQNSGREIAMPGGGRLWLLGIRSAGALSINLAFKNFDLPAGAKMFVYSPDGSDVLGAFTRANNQQDGEFATELVISESVIIEYYEPQEVSHVGTFELFRVTHAYRGVADYVSRAFGNAGSCQVNVACPSGVPWANEIKSVCMLVSGGNGFCSASLVNNVRQDGTPYVLTANHCGSSGFGTWVFRFNWQSATCSNPASSPCSNSISGAIQVAANPASDFSLVRINSVPPANFNVYYSGWSNVNTTVPSVVGIHHPSADIKKISFAPNPTVSTQWNGADTWQVGPWTIGTTEPGSSGSPIYDPNHHIIGQLFGGSSACGLPASQQIDFYGKFATSWNNGSMPSLRLRDWLDPDNTCATVLDGYDPNVALPSLDAEVLAIQNPVCNSASCPSSITPSVLLRNRGTTALTSATINWQLDSNPVTTSSWSGNLATNATATITLPVINPTTGAHTYTVYASSPNSSTDLNTGNDTAIASFTMISPTTFNLPIAQSFQNATFPPTNWTRINPDAGYQWQRHLSAGAYGGSPGGAYVNNFQYTAGNGQSDFLTTPYLNFSSSTSPLRLYFHISYARRTTANNKSLVIRHSVDCGLSWTRIYNKGRAGLATNGGGMVTSFFLPAATEWRTDSINIDALAGVSKGLIQFENKSANGNNLFIDNINILHGILNGGINELALQNSFVNIFSNPSDGNIQIDFDDVISGKVTLNLYNSYGQKVFSEILDAAKERTINKNFSSLSKGVYFLHFSDKDNTVVKKIILTD